MAKWHTVDFADKEPKWYGGVHDSYGGDAGKLLIGQRIGTIKILKPIEHIRRSYETASWWMRLTTSTGIFPVILGRSYHTPHILIAHAAIPAIVDEGFFPSSFGGNFIGKGPYVDRHKGQEDTIGIQTSFVDACLLSALSNDSIECLIDLGHWKAAIDDQEARLKAAYEMMPYWWNQYQAGEDRFDSRVAMVAHVGNEIGTYAGNIQKLKRERRYVDDRLKHNWKFSPDLD